jgi:deoxyribodipyrimidine photolyase-related protein
MVNKIALLVENNLFPSHDELNLDIDSKVIMIEDYNLCDRYVYHKYKLILILSSMRSHRDFLLNKGFNVIYLKITGCDKEKDYFSRFESIIYKEKPKEVVCYDFESKLFEKRIKDILCKKEIKLTIINSQLFITSKKDFSNYAQGKNRFMMQHFYTYQRKRLKILVDDNLNPINGKWSFDDENRKKLPKNIEIPKILKIPHTQNTREVIKILDELFPNCYGNSTDFFYPTSREDALKWMNKFFEERFDLFGPYEDALSKDNEFNFHSLLSPLINIGLLTPKEVVDKAIEYSNKNNITFSSLEGFIRQIIGWREFMRGLHDTLDFEKNYFNHKNKLNKKWYTGHTGILPLDDCITRVMKNGYLHHIERLMIVGNLMLLCRIDPNDVNKWFMELFIDSAEWVMKPNVYGMSQFADGGSFATKPYIGGSNYILKMSNYKKDDWCDIWDGLYWKFIYDNRELFSKNQRMSMMVKLLDKMDDDKKRKLFKLADSFIDKVTG